MSAPTEDALTPLPREENDEKQNEYILKVFLEQDLLDPGVGLEWKRDQHSFVLVPIQEEADITLHYDRAKEELVVERCDEVIEKMAKAVVRYRLPQNKVASIPLITDSISAFCCHLFRNNGTKHDVLNAERAFRTNSEDLKIEMRLYRLERIITGIRVPRKDEGNLFENGRVIIKAPLPGEDHVRYGIEILNHSACELFAHLFYFDPTDYSIHAWYLPRPFGAPLPSLKGGEPGKVTVGYGAGGGDPIVFVMGDGEKEDTGFIKLFVSNRYIDISHIAQSEIVNNAVGKQVSMALGDDIIGSLLAAVTLVSSVQPVVHQLP